MSASPANAGLIALALCAASPLARAQQAPTAGSLIQQVPPSPVAPRATPEIRIESGKALVSSGAEPTKILVKSLTVSGQGGLYSEGDLVAVAGFKPGSELTLSDLRAMAAKIADHLHRNGYFVAQAYLPAQDVTNGAVTIAVIVGQYGQVLLRNQTGLSESLAQDLVSGVNSGEPIAIGPLETRLLLLSDLPGVNVRSTLAPGASVGASDLIVDVTPGARVSGSVDADNAGNRSTGIRRLGTMVNLNNPSGHGDVLSARLLTSFEGLDYGRASYQVQLGRATVGATYTTLRYALGNDFASLQAHGTAQIASLYGSYPLLRSRDANLRAQLAYDAKTFDDKVDATSTATAKKAQGLMASLTGDSRDDFGGGGVNNYSLTWTHGSIDIGSPDALAADAATVQSNGRYTKLVLSARRLQSLSRSFSVSATLSGQIASRNLDTSEKVGLGGVDGVRAYPAGEAYGDQGYVFNLEVRRLWPIGEWPGQLLVVAFADTGTVTLNRNPFSAGPNRRTLSGAGFGVNWGNQTGLVIKAYWAHKLGKTEAKSAPDSASRFWIQAAQLF